MSKFLTFINGARRLATAITLSLGSVDGNKIVATKSNGKLDNSFVDWANPSAIGTDTPSTGRFTTLTLTGGNASTSTTTGDIVGAGGAGFGGNIYGGGSLNLPGLMINSNGAIQTTGVGAGSVVGNARGSAAVDLQTIRFSAARVASGTQSVVVGGSDNQASSTWSIVIGGVGNQATGFASTICGGENNQATAQYGVIISGMWGFANKFGQQAQAPGRFSTQGDAQRSSLVAYGATANATPANILLDNNISRCTLANNQAWRFTIEVIAKQVSSTNHASFRIEGTIVRGANAASTTLGTTNKTTILNGQSWDFNVSADTTNGALTLTATGAAATTIRWVAAISLVEVIG